MIARGDRNETNTYTLDVGNYELVCRHTSDNDVMLLSTHISSLSVLMSKVIFSVRFTVMLTTQSSSIQSNRE